MAAFLFSRRSASYGEQVSRGCPSTLPAPSGASLAGNPSGRLCRSAPLAQRLALPAGRGGCHAGSRRPTVVEEVSRKMRDTAGGTPALPIEEGASSSHSRSFAVQRLSECVGAASRVALLYLIPAGNFLEGMRILQKITPLFSRFFGRSVAFCADAARFSHPSPVRIDCLRRDAHRVRSSVRKGDGEIFCPRFRSHAW